MTDTQPLTPVDIRRAAMDLLARREHGSEELFNKLKRRFRRHSECADAIITELEKLTSEGLLSDQRFAAATVRQLILRGLGPRRLDAELRARGLQSDWQSCADSTELEVDWFDRAEQVYLKKFASKPWPKDRADFQKERAKRARFMQYRGFDPDHFIPFLQKDD